MKKHPGAALISYNCLKAKRCREVEWSQFSFPILDSVKPAHQTGRSSIHYAWTLINESIRNPYQGPDRVERVSALKIYEYNLLFGRIVELVFIWSWEAFLYTFVNPKSFHTRQKLLSERFCIFHSRYYVHHHFRVTL